MLMTRFYYFIGCFILITAVKCILKMEKEIRELSSHQLLFENLQGTTQLHTYDHFANKHGFFIFFPESNKFYSQILSRIQPDMYNRFLIIWPKFLNTSNIHNFMTQFWKFKLLNVLVLSRSTSEDLINVYSYDPFSETFCNEPKIIKTDVWNIKRQWFELENDLYRLSHKLKNLNQCTLNCFAKNRPPDSVVVQMNNNSWKLDGIGGKLLEEVRKRINFTPVIQVPRLDVSVDKYGYDISNGFPELVASLLDNSSTDLAFGIYSHIIYDNDKTEFSVTAVSECYGFAVPAHGGKEISAWMYYTKEFTFLVWSLILFEYVLSVFVLYILLRFFATRDQFFRTFNSVFLYVFSLNLGLSATPRISCATRRIFIGMIIIYSFMMLSAYQSSLGSFLTVRWKREQINTFTEILEANYQGAGIPQGKRILERFSADDKTLNKISQRFQVHREHFDSLIKRIQEKKDIITFGAQRFLQFYISHELNSTRRDDVYLLPKCVIRAHASPFLFKKGSPFLKPINNIIFAAVESGLTNFWYTYSTPRVSSPFSKITPLTIHQLESAFNLLIIGYFVSLIIFMVELFKERMVL